MNQFRILYDNLKHFAVFYVIRIELVYIASAAIICLPTEGMVKIHNGYKSSLIILDSHVNVEQGSIYGSFYNLHKAGLVLLCGLSSCCCCYDHSAIQ